MFVLIDPQMSVLSAAFPGDLRGVDHQLVKNRVETADTHSALPCALALSTLTCALRGRNSPYLLFILTYF